MKNLRVNNLNRMKYRIFKKDITSYRAQNIETGKIFEVGSNLVLKNCFCSVNLRKYHNASLNKFANSGTPNDFFACILCESFEQKKEPNIFNRLNDTLFFNPFKYKWFRDKISLKIFRPYDRLKFVFIESNNLKYIK